MVATCAALELVARERERREGVWGTQRHGLTVWLTVLLEEVGEVSAGVLTLRSLSPVNAAERRAQLGDLEGEIVQVAACAVAMLEHIREEIAGGRGMPSEVAE